MVFHHVHPDSTHSDNVLEMTLVATSSNLWFHHLSATTCRSHARIILLQTTIYNT